MLFHHHKPKLKLLLVLKQQNRKKLEFIWIWWWNIPFVKSFSDCYSSHLQTWLTYHFHTSGTGRRYYYFQPLTIASTCMYLLNPVGMVKAFVTLQSSCDCTLLWYLSNSKQTFKTNIFKVITWLRLRVGYIWESRLTNILECFLCRPSLWCFIYIFIFFI